MSLLSQILPKKETKEHILLLTIGDHRIHAAVFELSGNEVRILGFGSHDKPKGGNEAEEADIAITTAEKSLPEETVIEKTIFALPQHFLDRDVVKPEYIARLKKITDELALKPQGFIEYPAAIAYFLEREEGSPPTLLLMGTDQENLILSHIRVGKVQQHVVIKRSSSITDDFTNAIRQFATEILPSRILLYEDGEHADSVRHELLKFPWHKHTTFLHTPKIECLPATKVMTALIEAAASSLLKSLPQEEKTEEIQEIPIPIPVDETLHKPHTPAHSHITHSDASSFGFSEEVKAQEPEDKPEEQEHPGKSKPTLPAVSIPFSMPKLPRLGAIGKLLPIIVIVILVLLGAVSAFWYYPKATVMLIVYPLRVSQPVEINFATNNAESNTNTLAVKEYTEEVRGEKSVPTTGKSNVGEKAKGEITLYNKTTGGKTFSKGTILTNGDLKFTLDEDIAVASASDTGEGLTFGKTNGKITASAIGLESNLPGGSTFLVKDFPESSYTAKNNSALSGGSSKEVPSVSKEDQTKLEEALVSELTVTTKQTLSQKISAGEIYIPESITSALSEKKFSSAAGSEANQLTLTAKLTIHALAYNEADIQLISQQNAITVPPGFVRDGSTTSIKIENITTEKDKNMKAKASLTALFIPDIDQSEIKKNLVNKTYDESHSYLQTVTHIGGFKISGHTALPFFGKRLPWNKDNLTVTLATY